MAWFLNHCRCDECGETWDDEWSCTCDDDCPSCGSRHMSPYDSDDRTLIIEDYNGRFVVLRSADAAEDSPEYREVAEFRTLKRAEAFVLKANRDA